jgi:hypothetical protein
MGDEIHYCSVFLVKFQCLFVDIVPLPAPISVKKPMESSAPYTIPPEMRSSVTKKKQKLDPEQIFGGEFLVCPFNFNGSLI